ncbi:Hyoscyamine 6-dioxygenase [Quillaja saponaria]|uniref:Hyoscyamine 6-dioxygenase n=1 Tax=Quillaja saponaria TaxID=32244 RepID=A0AAD7Q3U9_QUISA|nr:Hyoscyamine 6-dioxygenase [Quillaja saponaria]
MENLEQMLVSSWCDVQSTVPNSYVHPPENRPGKFIVASSRAIPVVDLGGHDQANSTVQQILKACEEYGFFQVINHGVSEDLMEESMNVFKEFHGMPSMEKVRECSKDPNRSCKLYTSGENYTKDSLHYWKDALTHHCHPLDKYMKYWPEKPTRYREIVGKYTIEVGKLGLQILKMLCEGLGISTEYFNGSLSENPVLLVNHYPPCPDPSLTLGVGKHRDPSLITILLQDEDGLQVFKDGEWISIQPITNAFVVNVGLVLQIISNGRLLGAEHRVVTNSSIARTTAAYFIYPSNESFIEPSKELIINGSNQPLYKSISFGDFRGNFFYKGPKVELDLQK